MFDSPDYVAAIDGEVLSGLSVREVTDCLPDTGMLAQWQSVVASCLAGRTGALFLKHPLTRAIMPGVATPTPGGLVVVRIYQVLKKIT